METTLTGRLLSSLGLRRGKIDVKSQFYELLTDIIKEQFSELIRLHIGGGVGSAGEKEENHLFLKTLQEDFQNWTMKSLDGVLESKGDPALAFIHLVDKLERPRKLARFFREARAVFIEHRHEKQLMNYLECRKAAAVMVRALLDTTLSTPLRLYGGKDMVTKEAEDAMRNILQRIETIRSNFGFIQTDIPDINKTIGSLHRQIGIADEYVWLPMKPLITAPLADQDMQLLYARDQEMADRLARQIVRGDGVILITGYRGVGKSTFINATLTRIKLAEDNQIEDPPWKVVPIQMNVAKASNVESALRLCIRSIHRTLSQNTKWQGILLGNELRHLELANLRASFKVSMSQAEALSISRSLHAELGFNFGEMLVGPLKNLFSGILPKLSQKTSKEWNRTLDSTISLLDYDEDRAEEDIVRFINLLSTPRPFEGRNVRVKLVFIFDELDKMEVEIGQNALIKQLKNLFLTRNTVFLLVTSKEFYYMLLEDRKKEDSILGSYFSSVITVPLFDSNSTFVLLTKLFAEETNLSDKERKFIIDLARYLTYKAHGLPREIIRELRTLQQWVKGTLMTYLSERHMLLGDIQVYGHIQGVIENLNTAMDGTETTTITTTDETNLNVIRERVWLTEGRQEQIRRSLYVLIEDMIDQGYMTLRNDPSDYANYHTNFSTVSFEDFRDIFDQLTRSLARMKLPEELTDEVLFVRTGMDPTDDYTISVEPVLYKLTGRQILQRDHNLGEATDQFTTEELLEQVRNFLNQDSLLGVRRALLQLAQLKDQHVPDDVQDKIYNLFISSRDISMRLDAIKFLSVERFYTNLEKAIPETFIKNEVNDRVLSAFMKLVYDGATNKVRREKAREVMEILLARYEMGHASISPVLLNNLSLEASSVFKDKKTEARSILERLLKLYERSASLPEGVLSSLQSLAVGAGTSLPVELIRLKFYRTLPSEHLNPMMNALSLPQLRQVWKDARAQKSYPLNHAVMVITLLLLVSHLPETGDEIENWLAYPNWDDQDSSILKTANDANPKLYYEMERIFSGEKKISTAFKRVNDLIAPAQKVKLVVKEQGATAGMEMAGTEKTAVDKSRQFENPDWLNFLLGGAVFLLLLVPNYSYADPAEAHSTWDYVLDRLLQLVAFVSLPGILAIMAFWSDAAGKDKTNKPSPSVHWGYGIGTLLTIGAGVGAFWYLFKVSGTTVGLQIWQAILAVAVWGVPQLIQALIRFVISLFKR